MQQKTNLFMVNLNKWRSSNIFAIIVIGGALFIDGTIVSIVVPVIPVFLNDLVKQDNFLTQVNSTFDERKIPNEKHIGKNSIMAESFIYGLIIAVKSVSQLISNMFVGPLSDKIGHAKPLFIGFLIVFFSTACFAYSVSLFVLLVTRVVQGIGTSFLTVAGLAMLASRYSDDEQRGRAMTLALGGLNFGLLIGAPLAGVVYSLTGKPGPFLIVCGLTVFIAGLRLCMIDRKADVNLRKEEIPSLITLIRDPYISFTACCIFIGNISYAYLDMALPVWMLDTMNSSALELGLVFLPCDFAYLIGIWFYPIMIFHLGRWKVAFIANMIIGIILLIIPLTRSLLQLILPMALIGFANGMSQTALLPELANLMDLRYSAKYGNVYAIGDFAQCLSNGIVPVLSGFLLCYFNFQWLSTACAFLYFVSSPFMLFSRNVNRTKINEDRQPLMEKKTSTTCAVK